MAKFKQNTFNYFPSFFVHVGALICVMECSNFCCKSIRKCKWSMLQGADEQATLFCFYSDGRLQDMGCRQATSFYSNSRVHRPNVDAVKQRLLHVWHGKEHSNIDNFVDIFVMSQTYENSSHHLHGASYVVSSALDELVVDAYIVSRLCSCCTSPVSLLAWDILECGLCNAGDVAFDIDSGRNDDASAVRTTSSQHFTIIFNTFVLMTLFNEVNARKIHGQRNVIEGLNRNPVFVGIWISTAFAQVHCDIVTHYGSVTVVDSCC